MTKTVRCISLLVLVIVAGCGYRVAGKGGAVFIEGVHTLSIPIFENLTRRADIESIVTSAVVDEFINVADIVEGSRADAVIQGKIREYELNPVSFNKSDVVQEYRLSVELSLKVIRTADGKILWQDDVTDYEDFTVDTADVLNTKDMEAQALKKIARDTARLVRERMIEGF